MFVDDDPDILAALQSALRRDRGRWDTVFALGGELALSEIRKQPFDIVLSDLGMPGIDGIKLLEMIRSEHPTTVRILMSGNVDRETILRAVPVVHRLVGKPCETKVLRAAIERSLADTDTDSEAQAHRIIVGVDRLPTPPDIYFELTRLMQSATSNMMDVAQVVIRDPGISAKLLQLVNSAFFGTSQAITSIQQAVARLGIDRLRYLVLSTFAFSPEPDDVCGFALKTLQRRALRAACLAQQLAEPAGQDEAFAATLLHDIGYAVLARGQGAAFEAYRERIKHGEPWHDLDLELFGVSHAYIGARLLMFWGLPPTIVDAVQFHHDPGNAPSSCQQLASVIHVADAAAQTMAIPTQLNMESLERAGCAHLVPGCTALVERT